MNKPELDIKCLIDALQKAVVVLNTDLQVVLANQAFYKAFQIEPLAAEQPLFFDMVDNSLDVAPFREFLKQVQKEKASVESKQITCDLVNIGRKMLLLNTRWIAKSEYPNTILLTIEDITQQKQIEVTLSESEQRFRAQYKNLPVPTYTWRKIDEDFVLTDYNDAGEKITQGGITQYLGMTAQEMYGNRPEVLDDFNKCFQTKSTVKYEGKFYLRTIGEYGEFVITYVFVPPDIVMVHTEDVTIRKHAEVEVERYRRHLEDLVAERTAALERSNQELEAFSYSIAHDLRAPLRSITGFSQILLEDVESKLTEQEFEYFQRIIANGKHLAQLIDDILELSRITRSECTEQIIDLSAVAREITNELMENDPNRQATVNIMPQLLCKGDHRLLRGAMQNLLDNAWKYSSKKLQTLIEFGATEKNGEKAFYVRDNGAGFDMRYADKLFKPFQRMHKSDEFEGTGIGLATVQRIIRRHGGKVWAEAALDNGATFYFTLKTAGEGGGS